MSESDHDIDVEPLPSGSLSSRMGAAEENITSATTERFPIPNWEDMVEVELRMLGWKKLRAIADVHKKVRNKADQELAIAVHQLVVATEGFYEIEGETSVRVDMDWIKLAKAGSGQRGVVKPLPDTLTETQAVLALVALDTRAMNLWNEWHEWMSSNRSDVDKELVSDFGRTG